jgi:hypothetical protein
MARKRKFEAAVQCDAGGHGLEQVFPTGSQWAQRIYYDRFEGKYYDKATDLYIDVDEAQAYGVP